MSFKGFFYNALPTSNGDWDRKYNADDYSNLLKFVIGNGIIHFNNGTNLKVVNEENSDTKVYVQGDDPTIYKLKILTGYGWINGKAFENTTEFSGDVKIIDDEGNSSDITLSTIPMVTKGFKRVDRVVIRRDDSPGVRETLPYIFKGVQREQGTPVGLDINYAGNINGNGTDLCIAEIELDYTGNYPIVKINDTRDKTNLCCWVNCYFGDNYEQYCATINEVVTNFINVKTGEFNRWFSNTRNDVATVTMKKEIAKSYTVSATGKTYPIGIAEYNSETDLLRVYTNGIYENPNDYTINTDGTITFTTTKQVGAVIDFIVEKTIDGRYYDNPDETMIASVESRFTDIYEKLATSEELYNEVTYICTGTDDNIKISDLVKTFMAANQTDNARLKLSIRGNFGITNPYQSQIATPTGDQDVESFARWFDLSSTGNRKVILDFANCSPINISLTDNTANIIFYGANQKIENCVLKAGSVANTGTKILAIFGSGDVYHKDCKYSFICDRSADFTRHGRFDNCEVTLVSKSENATAFYTDPSGCVCEVNNGIYWLYVGKDVSSSYGTKLVYYNRSTSLTTTPDYSAITILRNVFVPGYTNSTLNGVSYFYIDGFYFKQDGTIFKTLANAGGYIRANNIITAATRMANDDIDSSTDFIAEGTIPKSRALAQSPLV